MDYIFIGSNQRLTDLTKKFGPPLKKIMTDDPEMDEKKFKRDLQEIYQYDSTQHKWVIEITQKNREMILNPLAETFRQRNTSQTLERTRFLFDPKIVEQQEIIQNFAIMGEKKNILVASEEGTITETEIAKMKEFLRLNKDPEQTVTRNAE